MEGVHDYISVNGLEEFPNALISLEVGALNSENSS